MALSELDLGPRSVVWDVGAGSGSVAVEAAMIAREGQAHRTPVLTCRTLDMRIGDRLFFTSVGRTGHPRGLIREQPPTDPRDQEQNAHGLVYFALINSSRHRCYLTSPYFIPDEPLLRALIGAALRGVDARVLVPARSDVRIAGLAARLAMVDAELEAEAAERPRVLSPIFSMAAMLLRSEEHT